MIKVMLIDPPVDANEYDKNPGVKNSFWAPPLWALCLGSYLKYFNPEIFLEIIDGQLKNFKYISERIKKEKPSVVGITAKTINYNKALEIARVAKLVNSKVVFGGTYVTSIAKEIIKYRGNNSKDYCVDYVVKGNGEKAFYEIVTSKSLKEIKNLVYLKGQNIVENISEVLDLNILPQLNFSLFNYGDYYHCDNNKYYNLRKIKLIRLFSQKGCDWREVNHKGCIYCSLNNQSKTLKKPEYYYREIENCVKEYKINAVSDVSDLCLEDQDWLDEFRELIIKSNFITPKLAWTIRAGEISNGYLKKMLDIKTTQVSIGIESGSQECLDSLNIGTNVESNALGIKKLSDNGLKILVRLILGAPGESEKTLNNTLNLARKLIKYKGVYFIATHLFTPYPNSPAWNMLLEKTNDNYLDKDSLNLEKAQLDWVKYFCNVNIEKLMDTYFNIESLNK